MLLFRHFAESKYDSNVSNFCLVVFGNAIFSRFFFFFFRHSGESE